MAVRHTEAIAEDVERVLGAVLPAIDLVDVRVVPAGCCECSSTTPTASTTNAAPRSAAHSSAFRQRYALEVSSPAFRARSRSPAHYERFAAVRSMYASMLRSGRRRIRGELLEERRAARSRARRDGAVS